MVIPSLYTGYKPCCNSYVTIHTVIDWPQQGNSGVTCANKDRAEWEYNRGTSATKVERPTSKNRL